MRRRWRRPMASAVDAAHPPPTNRLLKVKPIPPRPPDHRYRSPWRQAFDVSFHTAAQVLVIFGDNPERTHAKGAKICHSCSRPRVRLVTSLHLFQAPKLGPPNLALDHPKRPDCACLHDITSGPDILRPSDGTRRGLAPERCFESGVARGSGRRVGVETRIGSHGPGRIPVAANAAAA
jgi:hypothetical protein